MLQSIRDKITGWVAWTFIILIAIVFVFWGIDFGSGSSIYAAEVEGENIPAETVRRAWQQRQSQLQQMLRDELPAELVQSQQAALLDQFVRQSLLTQRADELGYRVSDEALAQRVMEFPQFQVDGQFSKDRYYALIRSSGVSEAQFERDLQAELLINQLQSGVVESAFVTPHELDRRYTIEKQAREVDYALIPAKEFASDVTVTDEQIQKWYEEHPEQYLQPESADLQYIELTRAEAESGITVTQDALRDYYEQNKERFESPERRRARHILITVDDDTDEAAAQKKAEELVAQAQAGGDFEQLAKEHSQDPGSAEQGGDLGWAQRGMFVGPFEDALFSMTPDEIRGPVKTQFGYHVLKLEEIESGQIRTFEEARVELEDEFRQERAQTIFYDESQKLADQAFASLTELDSVSNTLGLPLKTVTGFTREGGGDLGQSPEVIDAVFSNEVLERGENSPLIAIGEDRAVVLRVTGHKPAVPRPLAEVREQIEAQLREQAVQEAAAKKGADAIVRLKAGEAWSEVSSSAGLNTVGKRFVTRDDAIAPDAVKRLAFSASPAQISEAQPYYGGVMTDDGNYAVVAVTQIRDGDPTAESAQEKNVRKRRAEAQLGNEELAGYVAEAERNADIVKNPQVFQ